MTLAGTLLPSHLPADARSCTLRVSRGGDALSLMPEIHHNATEKKDGWTWIESNPL